jgi:hypothetical protein
VPGTGVGTVVKVGKGVGVWLAGSQDTQENNNSPHVTHIARRFWRSDKITFQPR